MLAAFFTGKEELEVREVNKPQLKEGGLIVHIAYAAICGTDLKIIKNSDVKIEDGKQRYMKLPRVIGHEFTGIVEKVASDVKDYKVGDRVLVFPTISCGNCHYCKLGKSEMCDNSFVVGYDCDGGFAQYISVSKKIINSGGIIKIPDEVGLDIAAVAEPFSCAINCFELSTIPKDGNVVVIGAGPLGSFICEYARLNNAGKIILIEQSKEQLEMAKCAPADYFLINEGDATIAKVKELTEGRGADVVVTACPAPAAQLQALDMVAKCGKVNFFGGLPREKSVISIDSNLIHYKECMIIGTHGSRPEHAKKALEIFKEKFDPSKYIFKVFKLSDINKAFQVALDSKRMKILIEME